MACRQASAMPIVWINPEILLIGPLGTNFKEISIDIHIFSFNNMHLKMSSGKQWPFCLGLSVLKKLKLWWVYQSSLRAKYHCIVHSSCSLVLCFVCVSLLATIFVEEMYIPIYKRQRAMSFYIIQYWFMFPASIGKWHRQAIVYLPCECYQAWHATIATCVLHIRWWKKIPFVLTIIHSP